jgi:hypothetical protein
MIAAGALALLVGSQIAVAHCGSCPGDKVEVKAPCPADCTKECCIKPEDQAKCDAVKKECAAGGEKKECAAGGEKKECAAPAEETKPAAE